MFILKILMFFSVSKSVFLQNSNPIVQVEDGKLEGIWDRTSENRRFAAFKAVPYAAPPTGVNRFEDPKRVISWSGVRNATVYGPPCLHLEPTLEVIRGEEDCLFMNIFTPSLDRKASMPVMVFIHGGDFMSGSGDLYNPIRFMNYNMVLITLNYRLGPLEYTLDSRTGSCYKFHRYPRNWSRAYMICEAEGGHLAIINCETEAQVIKDILAKHPENTLPPGAYKYGAALGYRDIDQHGEWVTVQGETLSEAGYEKFGEGQPDYPGVQCCGGVFRSGLLDNTGCEDMLPFICEKYPQNFNSSF